MTIPHEHHWVGPDQFSPVDYCGICSVPRQHQHHVHEKRTVSDCPDCIESATAFLSEGAAPRAEGPWDEAQAWADEAARNGDPELAEGRAASPAALDVERLAEAGGNVLDGRRIGSVRLYRNTITPDDWRAISAEYARLSRPSDERVPEEPE